MAILLFYTGIALLIYLRSRETEERLRREFERALREALHQQKIEELNKSIAATKSRT